METNLKKIAQLAEEKEEENFEFRSFLKETAISEGKIDKIVQNLYKKYSTLIDCTKCGNCCKVFSTVVKKEDI